MSSVKEDKSQAAEKIKAQALSLTKGMSRAQAERAAAAAARNVNAYGQKEEGPSRWQERKEAKRQMYLMSTEKAVKLGERKDLKSSHIGSNSATSQCQKCFQAGHWTYECKNERVYIARPSRSQQLKNPLKMKLNVSFEDNPDVQKRIEREEEEKRKNKEKEAKVKISDVKRKESKRKRQSGTGSGSETSEASIFETESSSSGSESDSSSHESSSSYSSSDSEDRRNRRRRKKNKQKKRRHHRCSSSSQSSESDSDSDSYSGDKGSRKKSRKDQKRH